MLAAFGGIGYAATSIKEAVSVAKAVVVQPRGRKRSPATPSRGATTRAAATNPGPDQQTIEVADNAVPTLLAHGDYLGECRKR
jgi:hypothetical protein